MSALLLAAGCCWLLAAAAAAISTLLFVLFAERHRGYVFGLLVALAAMSRCWA
jgi:hypothetical protein